MEPGGEIIKERKEKIISFLKKTNFLVLLGLLVLIWLAWYIRTANIESLKDITTNDYTLGPDLDPFLFLRYAKYIVEQGSLMDIDNFRYVPHGFNTAGETKLLPYMIAYFHKFFSSITGKGINYSAVIFPVFMFLLTVIAFFLFIRKVFEGNKHGNFIALISTLFLVVAPSLLSRTVAGIPEKESAGFFFIFLAFYFFISAWKAEKFTNSIILGFLAGLSTSLMGLIWGGWIYIFVTIALFCFICFIFEKIDRRKFIIYSLWLFASYLLVLLFSSRYTFFSLAKSTSLEISFIVFFIILVDFAVFKTKIRELGFIKKMSGKIPEKIISLAISIVVGLFLSSILFGISFVPDIAKDVISHLTQPYSDRLSFTVAENRQPYFGEWKESFGPIVRGFPIFFWIFFIGSIFLFYESVKDMEKKGKLILLCSYILFLFGLVFSRYSTSSMMNGVNFASMLVYFGSFLILAIAYLFIFYKYHKENNIEELRKINAGYLFLLAFFIISLIGARSAIRLIMVLAPPAAGIIGFFIINRIEAAYEKKEEAKKILAVVIAVLVIFASLYSLWYNYNATLGGTRSMVPSIYTQQWQKAMAWVRNSTPEYAVFSHWWDYGYWLQSIGNRPTVLDGGNVYSYWNHLLARHVLTGRSEEEALEFLYTHNASYLLIDSTDIGKYPAYSSIGSDENYDRYSWVGTFLMNEKATQEKKEEVSYFYQGGVALDEDYMLNDSGKQVFLSSGNTGVGALTLSIDNNQSFKQPKAIFVYQGQQFIIPLRYLYYKEKLYDFTTGYQGAMYLFPSLTEQGQGIGINQLGAAMFLSERNMRALWVRLYLLGDGKNFKLLHNEDDFLITNLKNQGADVDDFVFYGGVRGPIKIWEISYPENIKLNPDYLETDYPDIVRLATRAF